MTHLEALLNFTDNRIRDTWQVYGGKIYPSTQTQFAKDDIFQLQAPGTIWDNAIFYCKEEVFLTTTFNWADYTFSDQDEGTIMNNLNIIHKDFHCILTEAELLAITEPIDLSFIAFAALDAVDITDDELNILLLSIGVPFITLEELEFSRDDILNYMIKPALDEFYKWYPIITVEQFPAFNPVINIPIPPYAKSVQRVYIVPGFPVTGNHQNPITRYFDEVILAASSRGTFANPSINYRNRQQFMDIQAYNTFLLEKAVRQGAVNHGTRKRLRVELKNGRVIGYSNLQGIVEIEWASPSYNWADIPFNRLTEVREYTQSKILRAIGELRTQTNSNLPGTINYEAFLTKAEALETKVLDLWQNATKAVVVRG